MILAATLAFYIVSQAAGSVELLLVERDGADSLVTCIRIDRGGVLAAQRRERRVAPSFLAGDADPCEATPPPGVAPAPPGIGIVAQCGSREAVFRLPERPPAGTPQSAAALWRLADSVKAIAFNEGDPLTGLSAAGELEARRLGRSYIPALKSGRFDRFRKLLP